MDIIGATGLYELVVVMRDLCMHPIENSCRSHGVDDLCILELYSTLLLKPIEEASMLIATFFWWSHYVVDDLLISCFLHSSTFLEEECIM